MGRLALPFASPLAAALLIAACSGGDGDTGDAGETGTTAVSETVASTTTDPPATTPDVQPGAETSTTPAPTTTEPPPPEPATRQRIVIAGDEEVVWDWTTDRCEEAHIPDITARAFRNADGEINLTISHWNSYPMVGASFDELVTDCERLQLTSDYDPDPASFNDSEWIGSVYTEDGETVYAVVHNEYRGDTHQAARPGQCPSGQRLPCLDTSFTMAVSTDGGRTFEHQAEPPGHLIASLPYQYRDDSVPSGIRQPSNIVKGPDDFYYLFGNVSDQPSQEQWVCAMRNPDLDRPDAWRYWNGTDFTGVWRNPYVEDADASDKCAPLAFGALSGSIQESIVFDEAMGRYVMIGLADDPFTSGATFSFSYATSENLLDWTVRESLIRLPVPPTAASDDELVYAYPAIIDPDSDSLSFGTSDGQMYLYLSRFNFGGNSLDRDLVRWPIAVETYEPEAPSWEFDDESDLDDVNGGWSTRFDMAPISIADGALQFTTTGGDPVVQTGDVTLPAAFDQMIIRLRLPAGLSTRGELFWARDDDVTLDGVKYTSFDIDGTGEFTDVVVDLSNHEEWTGTIRSVRFDPLTTGELVDGAIDSIRFERSS